MATNEAFAARLSRKPEELTGTCIYDFLSPPLVEAHRGWVDRVIANREPVHFEDNADTLFFENVMYPVLDTQGRVTMLALCMRDITERKYCERERDSLIQHLQEYVARIKILRGLIPICSSCKRVRSDKGYWSQLEVYITEHSDAEFSHGLCPECATKHYSGL